MICPRDANELHTEADRGITIDRCHACHGAWYDYDELAELEATVADEEQRLGTVEYAKHESILLYPACSQTMHAFNYRAYNLELDACAEGHGFWLDAGESERVREIMKERVQPTLHPGDVGKFVAIDVITGEFEIDEDDYTAVARLRLRKPDADMWLARAGFPTTCRIGVVR